MLTELIREQAFQTAVMAADGILIMTLYRIFRNICRPAGMCRAVYCVLEIVFWITAAVITIQFLYYCAYGRISFHSALAFTGGALLWKKLFCDIIDKIFTNVFRKQGIHNRYGEKETQQPVQGHQPGNRH